MRKTYKKIAQELWGILDSIDTLPELLHPHDKEIHEMTWKMMVKKAEKRFMLLETDGYKLWKKH